jgi:hypothetical protein
MKTEHMNHPCRPVILAMAIFLIATFSVPSQQRPFESPERQPAATYTDEELESFVEAALRIIPLQQEGYKEMTGEIEKHDLSVERFMDIMEARQNDMDAGATQEEMEAFEEAFEAVREIQIEIEEHVTAEIESTGISHEKYEEIMFNYQHDPELQSRINEIMERVD